MQNRRAGSVLCQMPLTKAVSSLVGDCQTLHVMISEQERKVSPSGRDKRSKGETFLCTPKQKQPQGRSFTSLQISLQMFHTHIDTRTRKILDVRPIHVRFFFRNVLF